MTINKLQIVDGGIDPTTSTTNRVVSFPSNITAGSVLLACFSIHNNAPSNIIVFDDKGNEWHLINNAFESGGARGGAAYYAVANAGSIGNKPTVTFDKGGSGCVLGGSLFECANVHADIQDAVSVALAALNSGPVQATLGITAYTNDEIFAVLGMEQSEWSVATPLADYTDAVANNSLGGSLQHKVQTRSTTETAAYTPGWTISNPAHWGIVAFVLKGSTTLPTITSVSDANPRHGTVVTFYGVNLGASPGVLRVGGSVMTPTSWADGAVSITMDRDTHPYGIPLNVQVETSDLILSNVFEGIAQILPPVGKGYVNLTSVNATAAYRLTALPDLAAGKQVEYDNTLVTVYPDATFRAYNTIGAFAAAAWAPNVWGEPATQVLTGALTVNAGVGRIANVGRTAVVSAPLIVSCSVGAVGVVGLATGVLPGILVNAGVGRVTDTGAFATIVSNGGVSGTVARLQITGNRATITSGDPVTQNKRRTYYGIPRIRRLP